MADEGFAWIYLIFFLVPLARILPRIVRKWRNKAHVENQNYANNPKVEQRQESFQRPQNTEMKVLGEINRGIKNFSNIQKNLALSNQELESILKNLEKQELMKVVKKGSFFGIKVELRSTEKGQKRYYS